MGRLHAANDVDPDTLGLESADLFDVDVLVIGAGDAGVQAACRAAALGALVLVVDKRSKPVLPPAALQTRGVHWLLGHSALELLLDGDGAVRGAAGVRGAQQVAGARPRIVPERPWRVQAPAVVMATGDGLLMAVEAGAQLAGMEHQGGLRLADAAGATAVAGLYAAGRAAWHGADDAPGLPQDSSARSLLSGMRAGAAAAAEATRHGPVPDHPALRPAGRIGLRGAGRHTINPQATWAALQAVLAPTAQDTGSHPGHTAAALSRLDALWQFLRSAAPAPAGARTATREAAARLAMARWRLRSLLARSSAADRRLPILSGGLDEVWAHTEASVWPVSLHEAAGTPPPAAEAAAMLEQRPPPRPLQRLSAFAR